MFIFNTILIFSILGFFIHLFVSKRPKTRFRIIELLLLYQLVFNIGLLGVLSFIGLTFFPEKAAAHIDWPMCPFQQELGNASLGFGVIGILGIWLRQHFWTATVIGSSIWLFADGVGHLVDAFAFNNFSEGNFGILSFSDILIPIVSVSLLIFYLRLKPKDF